MVGASTTILIVEDEPGLRKVFRIVLETAGYRVCEAGTVREAIATAEREQPALILLDLGLPDASGLEVARALRPASASGRPVLIAMTGRSGSETHARVLEAGCAGHLVKPIEPRELLRRIPGWLDRPVTDDPAGSPA